MPQRLTVGGGTHNTGLVTPPGVHYSSTAGAGRVTESSGSCSSSSRGSSQGSNQGSVSGGTTGAKFRAVVSISSDVERDRIFYEDGNNNNNINNCNNGEIVFNYYQEERQHSNLAHGSGSKVAVSGTGSGPGPGQHIPVPPPPPPPKPSASVVATVLKTQKPSQVHPDMAAAALGMPDSTRWCSDGSLPKVVAHENGAIVNGYLLVNDTDNLNIAQITNPKTRTQTKRYYMSETVTSRVDDGEKQKQKSKKEKTRGEGAAESTFAGSRDVKDPDTLRDMKIVSSKGTIRGVKNRVRAGIATFLDNQDKTKTLRDVEKGKIVIYVTSVRIIRTTYERCQKARMILQTHMVCYEEVDIFMSKEHQRCLMERLGSDQVIVPQVFVDGQHLGGVEGLDYMNESGELRQIFDTFKKVQQTTSCTKCGGYRFVNCPSCHGSKKSLHRNHFTEEFCALRCVNCDENGLVRCSVCSEEVPETK